MNKKKMTIAILGLGSRGLQVYAPLIKENADRMELVAAADLDSGKIEAAKREYGVKAEKCFSSAEELLKADCLADALFICTQDRDHVEHAIAALKKGCLLYTSPSPRD